MQIRLWYILCVGLATSLFLSSCDRLGFADPAKEAASRDAESSATGGACRYAGRGIEDCFTRNPDTRRAAVFSGWKEMDGYMRENKIEVVKPEIALPADQKAGLAAKEKIIK
ncbi:MAG: hypothetical protein HHJ12_00390 [Glaciimonas sp.]|nr:hypothetical protein [Glaciimonas sp.]